jgi:hypothetical protein
MPEFLSHTGKVIKLTRRKARRLRIRINKRARRPNIYGEWIMSAAQSRRAQWRLWARGGDFRRVIEGKKLR